MKDIIGKTSEIIFSTGNVENTKEEDREIMISGKSKRGIIQSHPSSEGIRF